MSGYKQSPGRDVQAFESGQYLPLQESPELRGTEDSSQVADKRGVDVVLLLQSRRGGQVSQADISGAPLRGDCKARFADRLEG